MDGWTGGSIDGLVASPLSHFTLVISIFPALNEPCMHDTNATGRPQYEKLNKLTTAPRLNFTPGDVKALVAALTFVLRNAAKYDVPPEDLDQELQQLGLPRGQPGVALNGRVCPPVDGRVLVCVVEADVVWSMGLRYLVLV